MICTNCGSPFGEAFGDAVSTNVSETAPTLGGPKQRFVILLAHILERLLVVLSSTNGFETAADLEHILAFRSAAPCQNI